MRVVLSKSFFRGFAKSINIAGTKEWPDISNSAMKDYMSIRRDWEDAGSTIQRECNRYEENRK